jgi:tetratricopeptide (TPR) repeat protein
MAKITFILFFFISASMSAVGQKKNTTELPVEKGNAAYELQQKIYTEALRYEDFGVARTALYAMMALKPEDKSLKDTLTILFYTSGMPVQTVVSGRQILTEKPDNQVIMELVAISEEALGLNKEALGNYEKLHALSKKPTHLYKVASLQFLLKRFGECAATIQRLLGDDKAAAEKIRIDYDQGKSQEVSLKGACMNIMGLIAMELNQSGEAKKFFDEAIKSDPEFILPKGNLNLMEQIRKEQEKEKQSQPAKPAESPKK